MENNEREIYIVVFLISMLAIGVGLVVHSESNDMISPDRNDIGLHN